MVPILVWSSKFGALSYVGTRPTKHIVMESESYEVENFSEVEAGIIIAKHSFKACGPEHNRTIVDWWRFFVLKRVYKRTPIHALDTLQC